LLHVLVNHLVSANLVPMRPLRRSMTECSSQSMQGPPCDEEGQSNNLRRLYVPSGLRALHLGMGLASNAFMFVNARWFEYPTIRHRRRR
jgi:hypothetical protein